MSPEYIAQIGDLNEWFKIRLPRVSPQIQAFSLSHEQYQRGADALPKLLHPARNAALTVWLWDRNYELSYSQLASALFSALMELQLMTVTPPPSAPAAPES